MAGARVAVNMCMYMCVYLSAFEVESRLGLLPMHMSISIPIYAIHGRQPSSDKEFMCGAHGIQRLLMAEACTFVWYHLDVQYNRVFIHAGPERLYPNRLQPFTERL